MPQLKLIFKYALTSEAVCAIVSYASSKKVKMSQPGETCIMQPMDQISIKIKWYWKSEI